MPLVAIAECPKCHRKKGERHVPVTKRPSLPTIERWNLDGIAKATDGCQVEPDGECPHGHTSWLRVMRFI